MWFPGILKIFIENINNLVSWLKSPQIKYTTDFFGENIQWKNKPNNKTNKRKNIGTNLPKYKKKTVNNVKNIC